MDQNPQTDQYVSAVMHRYSRYSSQDVDFLRGVAQKQLNALGKHASDTPTFDNVLNALIMIFKSSKILGQTSIRRQIEHWIEFRNKSDLSNLPKIATFLKMVLDSGHPDGELGSNLMKAFNSTSESDLHSVWDVLCVFPLIVY